MDADDARRDPIPLRKAAGCRALEHSDRFAAAHEVAGKKALADDDVAHLIEAHHRMAKCLDVGARPGALLPAPALQVILRDVQTLPGRRHEVFERTPPQSRRPVFANDPGKFVDRDLCAFTRGTNMAIKLEREFVPPLVASRPFDQPFDALRARHRFRLTPL